MKYELQMFERIINGDLSPFSNGFDEPEKYIKALKAKHSVCFMYTIASFKKAKDKFILSEKKVVSSLHPLAEKSITPQQNLFKVADIEDIAPDAIKLLKLKKQNIVNVSYSRQPNKTFIYIKEARLCEEIPFNEAKYYYYNDLLKEEGLRIKEEIKDVVFKNKNCGEVEEYIHKQQQSVINLCFTLMEMFDLEQQKDIYKPATEFTDVDILNLVYIRLEELLRFIEKNYFEYIDENIKIPFRSTLSKIYNTTAKLQFVKSNLLSSSLPPELLKIIYEPFLKLGAITLEERISYREFMYCNTYLDAFYQSIKEHDNTIGELEIKKIVYQVNYNSPDLCIYKIEIIKADLNKLPETTDRINHLYLCLKIINQRTCRINIFYDRGLPSLKDQVTGWIEEEINYLNKSQKLLAKPEVVDLFSHQEKVKLQSAFTVAQLAFFYKLQADAGIITHKTQNDIIRHIADNYKTSNVSDISFDSLRNKFYNLESSTVEVVKEKIIEILNQLKSIDLDR